MYLFFDTETTGKAKSFKKGPSTDDNWPLVVQLAWLLTDGETVIEQGNFIIDIGENEVEPGAEGIHGISKEISNQFGIKRKRALLLFDEAVKKSKAIVAHNYNFDSNVLASEFLREKLPADFLKHRYFCTMEESTDFCELKGGFGGKFKWTKLVELHEKLFDTGFDGAHNAMIDVEACSKCFFGLVEEKVLDVEG